MSIRNTYLRMVSLVFFIAVVNFMKAFSETALDTQDPDLLSEMIKVAGFEETELRAMNVDLEDLKRRCAKSDGKKSEEYVAQIVDMRKTIIQKANIAGKMHLVQSVVSQWTRKNKSDKGGAQDRKSHTRYDMLQSRIDHLKRYLDETSNRIKHKEEKFQSYRAALSDFDMQNMQYREARQALEGKDYRESEMVSLIRSIDNDHRGLSGKLKKWEDDLRTWILQLMYTHEATPPTEEKEGYAAWLLNRILGEQGIEL